MLRTVEDAETLAADLLNGPRTAVIIGAGLIGVETAENLARRGIQVTLVDAADQVLPPLTRRSPCCWPPNSSRTEWAS